MIVHFPLCHGASLKLCGTCDRLVDQHPHAVNEPHQSFVTPTTNRERCAFWKARPSRNPPRQDTGD
jgi:hypothetical protein